MVIRFRNLLRILEISAVVVFCGRQTKHDTDFSHAEPRRQHRRSFTQALPATVGSLDGWGHYSLTTAAVLCTKEARITSRHVKQTSKFHYNLTIAAVLCTNEAGITSRHVKQTSKFHHTCNRGSSIEDVSKGEDQSLLHERGP